MQTIDALEARLKRGIAMEIVTTGGGGCGGAGGGSGPRGTGSIHQQVTIPYPSE
jgi:hypothetical protein